MACNCGNTYNIGMGCCEPVLGPVENYYTKYQIDKMIEGVIESGCCISPEEVDDKIESAKTEIESEIPSLDGYATEQWVLDKHYISGVDLSDYALKSEIPTVPTSNTAFTNDAGYLTEHQSLSGYVTDSDLSAYTYDKATIDEKIASGGTFDPTQYYNKTQTDNLLNDKLDVTAYTPTDLSNYDTKSEVNNKISTATGLVYNTLTAHTSDNSVHVTQTEKNTWNSKVDQSTLNNYLLKSKIWCGTQLEYDSIINKDSETLYLIHD